MQTNKEAEQVTLSDLGICCGKMSFMHFNT